MTNIFFIQGRGIVDCGATLLSIALQEVKLGPDTVTKDDYLSACIVIKQAAFWSDDIEIYELFGELLKNNRYICTIILEGEGTHGTMHGMSIILRHLSERTIPFQLDISLCSYNVNIPLRYISRILADSAIVALNCKRPTPFQDTWEKRKNATIFDHHLHYLNACTLKGSKLKELTLDIFFAKKYLPYFMQIEALTDLTLVAGNGVPQDEVQSHFEECLPIIRNSRLSVLIVDMQVNLTVEFLNVIARLYLHALRLGIMDDSNSHFQTLLNIIVGHPTLRIVFINNVSRITDMTMKVVDCTIRNQNLLWVVYTDAADGGNFSLEDHPDFFMLLDLLEARKGFFRFGYTYIGDTPGNWVFSRIFSRSTVSDEYEIFPDDPPTAHHFEIQQQNEKNMKRIFSAIKKQSDIDPVQMDFIGCDLNQTLINDLSTNFENLKTLTFHGTTFHPPSIFHCPVTKNDCDMSGVD